MERNRGARIFGGVLIILIGVYLLLIQFYPDLRLFGSLSWPLIMVGGGIAMFIFGLLGGNPGMAVPAAVVSGIGLILYYQNETGDWASWSYIWALIPGFAGVGGIVAGLLGDRTRKSILDGITLIIISGIMFLIFGSFFGGLDLLGDYWPVLLILLGIWILISYFLRGNRSKSEPPTPNDQR